MIPQIIEEMWALAFLINQTYHFHLVDNETWKSLIDLRYEQRDLQSVCASDVCVRQWKQHINTEQWLNWLELPVH